MAQLAACRFATSMVTLDTKCALDKPKLVTKKQRESDGNSRPTLRDTLTSPSHVDSVHHADVVQKLLLPWSCRPLVIWTEIHEVRPVTLPLDQVPKQLDEQHRTTFGVHWENLRISAVGQVSCDCCDAFRPTVDEYRKTVLLIHRRWIAHSVSRRSEWQRQGFTPKQIHAKALKLYPQDGFFNETMAAASDEELMTYVCNYSDMSHSFRVYTEDTTSYRWRSVFDLGMRTLCQQLLQPIRAEAEKASTPVIPSPVRLSLPRLGGSTRRESDDVDEAHEQQRDFVGVTTAAGLVVGFFYVVD